MNTIESNCRDRESAKKLHQFVGEMVSEGVANLASDYARAIFWQLMYESVSKFHTAPNPNPKPAKTKPAEPQQMDTAAVRAALEITDEIMSMADEVPSAGQGFANSVCHKAESIGNTIEKTGVVTDAQMTALQNMREGLLKWLN